MFYETKYRTKCSKLIDMQTTLCNKVKISQMYSQTYRVRFHYKNPVVLCVHYLSVCST